MVVHTGCERRRGWHEGDMVAGMVVILAMVAKWGWCRGLALVLRWSGEAEESQGLDLVSSKLSMGTILLSAHHVFDIMPERN